MLDRLDSLLRWKTILTTNFFFEVETTEYPIWKATTIVLTRGGVICFHQAQPQFPVMPVQFTRINPIRQAKGPNIEGGVAVVFMQVWQPRITESRSLCRLNPGWLFMSTTTFEFCGAGGGAISLSASYTGRDGEQIFSKRWLRNSSLEKAPTTGPGLWTICDVKLAMIPRSPLRKFLIHRK